MALSFNISGACVPGQHYMLPPARRLGRVMRLIEEGKFFVFYSGRQTGKTTSARWLVDHYNAGGDVACTWVDLQLAREQPDPQIAFHTVLNELHRAIKRDLPAVEPPDPGAWLSDPNTSMLYYLQESSRRLQRPLAVLFDEADGLVGATMVSFLSQLRAGYLDRSKTPFLHSVALIGLRQVRDYVISSEDRQAVSWLGTTSPFNITAEALTLGPFSREDVGELLRQHSAATGQSFLDEAMDRIYDLSQGHPWLVNALAAQIVHNDVEDRSVPITAAHVEAARETIILERRSHIDSLIRALREPRVRRIIEPMLVGERIMEPDALDDDYAYVLGLGLITRRGREIHVANPIYREVIPRVLSFGQQIQIRPETERYQRPDGGLDMHQLMQGWQAFWREDGHVAAASFAYREAGPHLMLMAFLQAHLNGKGQIDREYGLGRKALDLLICFGPERHAIEIKVRRDRETEQKGLKQLGGYLDLLGLREGWLVIFDQRKGQSWKQKLKLRSRKVGEHKIWIVGC